MMEQKSQYKYLNFYCNWALHSRLHRTNAIADFLHEFEAGVNDEGFTNFKYLSSDLRKFIENNGLSKRIFERSNYLNFIRRLIEICTDTPVKVCGEKQFTITLTKPVEPCESADYEVAYRIDYHD